MEFIIAVAYLVIFSLIVLSFIIYGVVSFIKEEIERSKWKCYHYLCFEKCNYSPILCDQHYWDSKCKYSSGYWYNGIM